VQRRRRVWGGVVPGNAGELAGMVADGVRGFKCFLVDSGVAEFGWVGEAELRPAMQILAAHRVPLLVHAEVAGPIDRATASLAAADPRCYATYLARVRRARRKKRSRWSPVCAARPRPARTSCITRRRPPCRCSQPRVPRGCR